MPEFYYPWRPTHKCWTQVWILEYELCINQSEV